MRKVRLGRCVRFVALVALVVFIGAPTTFALTASPNYQITEMEFGSGASIESCSDEYCAQATIGSLSSGGGSNASYSAEFGPITPDEPLLEVIVEEGESDLGVLTTERTATKTMTVKVRNYLSDGYTLQLTGDPPKYGDHALHTPTTPTQSLPGSEQFAINAVANTEPEVGADPLQVPSGEFSFGRVLENYSTPNLFMYSSGDVVARSDSESGQTHYTISMIVNVANNTPAGHYAGDFSAIVVPVY